MSLNWDISKIENHEELLVGEGDEWSLDGITEAFIWTSMVTGLGADWRLTAEFAPEFYARIKLYERVVGRLTSGPNSRPITPEDVRRRIGLRVNASSVSRAAFVKSMVTNDLDRDAKAYRRATVEVAA